MLNLKKAIILTISVSKFLTALALKIKIIFQVQKKNNNNNFAGLCEYVLRLKALLIFENDASPL